MTREPIRVSLDGHVHLLVEDEHTACGLLVPHGTEWVDAPVDCPEETGKKKADAKRKA